MQPAFENLPIIKLSFIFRRGLKMKLVRDKSAEPFCRFYSFLSHLQCISLLPFFPLSGTLFLRSISIFSIRSPPLPFPSPSFFSRIQRAMTHSLRWLPSFSILRYTLLTQNDTLSFHHRSLSSRHSFSL